MNLSIPEVIKTLMGLASKVGGDTVVMRIQAEGRDSAQHSTGIAAACIVFDYASHRVSQATLEAGTPTAGGVQVVLTPEDNPSSSSPLKAAIASARAAIPFVTHLVDSAGLGDVSSRVISEMADVGENIANFLDGIAPHVDVTGVTAEHIAALVHNNPLHLEDPVTIANQLLHAGAPPPPKSGDFHATTAVVDSILQAPLNDANAAVVPAKE